VSEVDDILKKQNEMIFGMTTTTDTSWARTDENFSDILAETIKFIEEHPPMAFLCSKIVKGEMSKHITKGTTKALDFMIHSIPVITAEIGNDMLYYGPKSELSDIADALNNHPEGSLKRAIAIYKLKYVTKPLEPTK
jgi:hypothetical protein